MAAANLISTLIMQVISICLGGATDGTSSRSALEGRRIGLGDREPVVHPGGVVVGEVADKLILPGHQVEGHPA